MASACSATASPTKQPDGPEAMEPSRLHWDVAIIGSGPVGLTLANLLGVMGVRTLVVERNATTVQEPRAVSIDDESLRTMQAAGVVGRGARRHRVPGYGSHYYTPGRIRFAKVEPTGRPYGYPAPQRLPPARAGTAAQGDALGRFGQVETRYRLVARPLPPSRTDGRGAGAERTGRRAPHRPGRVSGRLRRGGEPGAGAAGRATGGDDLRRALADRRLGEQREHHQAYRGVLRPPAPLHHLARAGPDPPVRVQAAPRRNRRRVAGARHRCSACSAGPRGRPACDASAARPSTGSTPGGATLVVRPGAAGRRRRAPDAALRRAGHEQRHPRRAQPGLEAGRGAGGRGWAGPARQLSSRSARTISGR